MSGKNRTNQRRMFVDRVWECEPDPQLKDLLSHSKKIVIDEVAKWFWGNSKEVWMPNDIPNSAPPFDVFWMEWNRPNLSNFKFSEEEIELGQTLCGNNSNEQQNIEEAKKQLILGIPKRIGILARFMTLKEAREQQDIGLDGREEGWIGNTFYYSEHNSLIQKLVFTHVINADGSLTLNKSCHQNLDADELTPEQFEMGQQLGLLYIASVRWIWHLAISFMHCKNIRVKGLPQQRRTRRQRRSHRNGKPHFQYNHLVITPMTKIINVAMGQHGVGAKKALHICRGHFKDFRKSDTGLFGKHKNLYWWESQVRGDKKFGITFSDYEVKGPP